MRECISTLSQTQHIHTYNTRACTYTQAIESFPTLAELAVAERSLTDTTAAALIDGLAAHCRAVTALSLHRLGYYYPTPMDTHMSAQR